MSSLLEALGWAIDRSSWWGSASTDVLLDAPVPMGHRRARRLDPALVQALAHAGAEGTFARAPGRLTAAMARFRRWHGQRVTGKTVTAGTSMVMLQYQGAGQAAFSETATPVLSVALDGTRMDGRDTLYVAVYAPATALAIWAPPQAADLALLAPRDVR